MTVFDVQPFNGMHRFGEHELNKLARIADAIGTRPDCLANVIGLESGFQTAIRNVACIRDGKPPSSCATGLIQFRPDTAKRFGTTTDALASMSALRQLDFVARFYAPHRGKVASCRDLYLATFLPAFVGTSMATVLGEKDSKELLMPGGESSLTLGQVYASNPGLDVTKDGVIRALDLDLMMTSRDTAARERGNKNPALIRKADTSAPEPAGAPPVPTGSTTTTLVPIAITLAGLLLVVIFGRKR